MVAANGMDHSIMACSVLGYSKPMLRDARALVVVTGDKVQIADAMNGASSKSLLMPA
jgi:hypothetical protein